MISGRLGVCSECALPSIGDSTLCIRHLRGLALVFLDRKRWPRLKLGSTVIAGDDQWRPFLREASGKDFVRVLKLLDVDPTKVSWR